MLQSQGGCHLCLISSGQQERGFSSCSCSNPLAWDGDGSVQRAAGRAGRELECPGCGCCSSQPMARRAEPVLPVLVLLINSTFRTPQQQEDVWISPVFIIFFFFLLFRLIMPGMLWLRICTVACSPGLLPGSMRALRYCCFVLVKRKKINRNPSN